MDVNKLYVGNLSYAVTDEQLQELFSNYGTVKSVNVIKGKGFGFVEMETAEEAQKARDGLDGTEYEGRTMKIGEARPPKRDSE